MKGEAVFFIFMAVILVLAITISLTYITAHYNGYKHGLETAELYYEYTAEFPPDDWAKRTSKNSLGSVEAIEKRLYPFGKK